MSDPINGGSGPGGPDWPADLEPVEAGEEIGEAGAAFGAALGIEGGASPLGDAGLQALDAAIGEVAGALARGELADPTQALEAVVGRAVDLCMEADPPEVRRAMAEQLCDVLLADPFFVLEVEALLSQAMEVSP